jgi:hypothetical protein
MTWVPPPTALVRLLISFTKVYSKALLCEQCMIQEPGNADDAWSVLLQVGVGGSDTRTKCASQRENCKLTAGKVTPRLKNLSMNLK